MSPTGRTLVALRRSGYLADVVERWVPHANLRQDLFGFADIIAIRAGEPGALLIQTTTAANLASRRQKAQRAPALRTWLATGNRFELWGWSQRNGRWEAKREALTLPDLAAVVVELKPPRRRRSEPGLFDAMI
ncbi:MAG TPA: hypothetical protein VKS79_15065 [Gemmataceae bacterium]|nr:hypothetical protein [Gemmataceae bacterium]